MVRIMSLEEVSNAINAQFKHQNRLVKPRPLSLLRTRKNWDSIIGGYSTECGAREHTYIIDYNDLH